MSRQTGWIITGALGIVALGGTAAVAGIGGPDQTQDLGDAMNVTEQSPAPTSEAVETPSSPAAPPSTTGSSEDPSTADSASGSPSSSAGSSSGGSSSGGSSSGGSASTGSASTSRPSPATVTPTPSAVYKPAPLASDSAWTPVSAVSAQSWSAPSAAS